ncbi:hypothetical protein NEMIN01_0991 [Nematocida minor]|uniref:uncharacterized protein n=1 Tax=Nematocida minor TaxID=1912983 RepID=UPI0022207FA0|nr:uncharacterized protein NEMIN01_0991 [Nematocida minor]KAI5190367.1 hypothetical protein NEMIN01_0991 [Nematocida minor]
MYNLRHLQEYRTTERICSEEREEMKKPEKTRILPVANKVQLFSLSMKNSLHDFENTWTK